MSVNQAPSASHPRSPGMAICEAVLEGYDAAASSWERAIAEAWRSVDGRLIWLMEFVALSGLAFVILLLSGAHTHAVVHLAVGLIGLLAAAAAFTGACILAYDPDEAKRRTLERLSTGRPAGESPSPEYLSQSRHR